MATACQLSEDQFLCSICLDVFTAPVTLACGHNFCKKCIDQHWSHSLVFKCPYCKKKFNSRPELEINIFIAEMAAHFRQSQNSSNQKSEKEATKPGEVSCDMCSEPKCRALKSCLVCLCSYCESHLEPHLKMGALRRHQLTEPQGNLEERVCAIHNKPLELFCSSERICVCVLCVYSEHRGHEVIPLKEASEQQKILMRKTEDYIQKDIDKRMKKIAVLHGSVGTSHAAADREISEGVKVFTALKESVERGLDRLISEIKKKKTYTKKQAEGLIQEIEQEICELKKRRAEMQQLCQSEDPLLLLQTSTLPSTPTSTRDWTSVTVCAPTYEGTVARALSQLEQDFNEKTWRLYKKELNRVKTKKINVTLNGKTAHPQLTLSMDGGKVHCNEQATEVQSSPSRFDDSLFVLGEQCLFGSSYFEAKVKGKTEWTLGVALESVNRKGPLTLNPQNGFWTIALKDGAYYVSDNPKIFVFTKCKPEKVGVFVDPKERVVSFYDVEAAALLYAFTSFTFNKKLYPICSPGNYSVTNAAPIVFSGNFCVHQ